MLFDTPFEFTFFVGRTPEGGEPVILLVGRYAGGSYGNSNVFKLPFFAGEPMGMPGTKTEDQAVRARFDLDPVPDKVRWDGPKLTRRSLGGLLGGPSVSIRLEEIVLTQDQLKGCMLDLETADDLEVPRPGEGDPVVVAVRLSQLHLINDLHVLAALALYTARGTTGHG